MSTHAIRNGVLAGLAGLGGFAILNNTMKPSRTQGIASGMRRDLDAYNAQVQLEQDPRDTLFDRSKLLKDVKARKPWNMSYADKEMSKRTN